ncbi:MAG: hypothetical protein JWP49_2522 [Phenylobacterium sp.]|jgi:hypothetical protein|nr:hypothetical protein [Phenylobacterium sp.]
MNGIGLTALAGLCGSLVCGGAGAAEPQGWLYVVNAAARPLTLVVDGSSFDLPARARVSHLVSAGPHGLAAILGGRTVSEYDSLDAAMLAADRKGRAYWCFLAGEIKGAPRLTQMDVNQCRALVEAGDDSAAPIAAPIASR